jgi:hypothetical protein
MLDSGGQEKLQTKITAFFDAWQDDARLIPLGEYLHTLVSSDALYA